ncbi:MAG: 23S rRNA (guanosine(2251)-2'-O)-methyltransferase RlmB [Candidatus Kaiserbacteria bacterium]|nr:23S rRNA (guanosine(2251)-2'-O)-methyltransferase RlmB [Candidatus Kaiserbacteria bacterium]
MNDDNTYIYGKHAVKEAVSIRPDIVSVIYLADEKDVEFFKKASAGKQIALRELNLKKLPKGVPSDAVHQGVIAEINPKKLMVDYEDFMRDCDVTSDTAFVLFGEVQDPHNVGAVIRSAVAFGITGILIPEHRQAQVNGTVIKVSAGMAFKIPLIQIGNVNNTVKDLKERGFWVYGLDGEAEQSVADEQFEKPSVLILGNEGEGIRQKTLEHCDIPLRIPMSKKAESLNASVAAGIVLHAWSVKHPERNR